MADANETTVTNAATPANSAATPATATTTPAKVKTVLDDMPARRVFDTQDSATAYILDSMTTYSDIANYSVISPVDSAREGGAVVGFGQDSNGNFTYDPEIFPSNYQVVVAVLTTRGEGAGSSKVKAIVIYPQPPIDLVLADKAARDWLSAKYETEINRAAVRVLRDTKDSITNLSDISVLDQMPRTLADYISTRTGGSTILEAFEDNWKQIKAALSKLSKSFKLANLPKREFRNAMSSSAYASQYYPTLEDAALGKDKRGSLFVIAIGAFKAEAAKAGKDFSIFDGWLNTRDEMTIDTRDSGDDEDDIELSSDMLLSAIASGATETEESPLVVGDGPSTDSNDTGTNTTPAE